MATVAAGAAQGDPGGAPGQLLLQVRNVTQRYEDKVVLRNVDLDVWAGEYVTVLGPSGSGKSVLLRLIAGFEDPTEGEIAIGGRNMVGVPAHLRNVGLVFQNFALFPHLKVGDNIAYGLRNRAHNRLSAADADRKVDEMLQLVGLEGLKDRRVNQISGGQRQRVALARTLATDPQIVLLDEPLGALDANLRASMKVELRKLQTRLGATFVHVTGNEEEALAMADRIIVLERGQIAQFDAPEKVFARPKTAHVAFALSRFNLAGGRVEGGAFVGDGFSFPMPPGESAAAGPATYCVGYDRVDVEEIGTPIPEGYSSIVCKHVSHEYSGAIVTYLFDLPDGQHFEAQYHLHHRKAKRLEGGAEYLLWWPANRAFVYSEVME